MDDALGELARRIRDGTAVETTEQEEQELYYDLERHRPRFLQLFDVGARSAVEAKDIENRKYKFQGKQLDLKAQLVRPVLFAAEQLDCSEYHCAILFARAERRHPNFDISQLVEKVVEAFHAERSALLDCLLAIFEGSTEPRLASAPLGMVLQKFTTEIVGTMLNLTGGRRGRFPERILLEIDRSVEGSAKLSTLIVNATSHTNAQCQGNLSHDVLQTRLDCLRMERRQLGYLIFIICALHHMSGVEIIKMAERLAKQPQDDMMHYILTATLVALDLPDTESSTVPLYSDRTFVASFTQILDDVSQWKSPRLRAVVSLKWSIFIWMARHRDPELADTAALPESFNDDNIEKRVWDAVRADIFPFLSEMTLLVQPMGSLENFDGSFAALGVKSITEGDPDTDVVDEFFKIFILRSFETLVTTFIVSMSAIIRRIKHRQEDVGLASSRANRPVPGGRTVPHEDSASPAPRNDVAQLFEFIGVLYTSLPPDEGLKFWVTSAEPGDGKLFAFIRWATESRERTLVCAAYDMLAGIAKGRSSAEVAYNYLSSSGATDRAHGGMLAGGGNLFSWSTLFSALIWWAETLPNPYHPPHHHQSHSLSLPHASRPPPTLSDQEALLLSSSLRFLRTVLTYAPAARLALVSMPDFRAIPTLLALLQHGIQLELKGMIMEVLAAFCEPGAGVGGVEICRGVWSALERAELINLRAGVGVGVAGGIGGGMGIGSGGGIATRGVENELEGVETPAQRYPATIPFLRLLRTLIHTPKSLPPQHLLVEYEPLDTIPPALGQPARLGGISPYVRFVVDTVLLRARSREFLDPADKWRMVDGALGFVERCLASYGYDLKGMLLFGVGAEVDKERLRGMQVHPGFELMVQVLTESPLRGELMDYIGHGVDALASKTIKSAQFERVMLRVLRIVHCVLEVQDIFIEVLLPMLAELEGGGGGGMGAGMSSLTFLSSSIVPLDHFLNWSSHLIIKIATCTLHATLDESKLLAIKIIGLLSQSPVFTSVQGFGVGVGAGLGGAGAGAGAGTGGKRRMNRLAVVFERDAESEVVRDGFVVLLQRNVAEDGSSQELVDMATGAGAPMGFPSGSASLSAYGTATAPLNLTHAIRVAILDLLLQNTVPDAPAPNVAHALLGFYTNLEADPDRTGRLSIRDEQGEGRKTCLHVVLEMLNTGISRPGTGTGKAHGSDSDLHGHGRARAHAHGGSPTFISTHPALAERCYRLIHQLCSHRTTSAVMMRYLRTQEDFFVRHLLVLPFRAPAHYVPLRAAAETGGAGEGRGAKGGGGGAGGTDIKATTDIPTGMVAYGDGACVPTTSNSLTAFLRIRAWVLQSVALELHVLTEMGQSQRASRLLTLLFGNAAELCYDDGNGINNTLDGLLNPFAPGQALIRIIELFQSFDFEWRDGLASVSENVELKFFAGIDVEACLRVDAAGCEVFDVDALLEVMYRHRRQMQAQGTVAGPHMHEQLRRETRYILSSCTIENNRRQVQYAKGVGFESWQKLLDICLAKGFHRLPQDRRESILFDLMHIVPPAILQSGAGGGAESTAVMLSEVMLSLVTKLRGDRQQQQILQSTFDDSYAASLPVDRLKVLLKNLLECLAGSGKTELVRGNLYASLVNYLHLVEDARDGGADVDYNHLGSEPTFSMSGTSFSRASSVSSHDELGDGEAEAGAPFVLERSHGATGTQRGKQKRTELEVATLAIVNKDVEGFIATVSADAIDGTEVWRTVAFALLDALVGLSRLERPHRVLGLLGRKGYLYTFVQAIKEADKDLQEVLCPDPDNLNTLYVYEAKMALLIRIAQTQLGAQRLLESRVFQVLALCDFIDARPEADQSFLDHDSFLPSAVHRYHQLVLPALELGNSIIATLGMSVQASKPALGFLLAHRETFLILLRDSTPSPSLQQIRELHLLISMCSYVTSRVERAELRTPASGFGGIHSAILSLAAKCLYRGRWQFKTSPTTDTEREEATVKAPGYGRYLSTFDAKVENAVEFLHEALWMYLEAASDSSGENEFAPVFTPIGVSHQQQEAPSQINAPAPTISDSIEALSQVVNNLGKVLHEVTDISAKLSSKDTLGLEEVDEIAQSSGVKYTEDLDMMQRRLLAHKELEKARETRIDVVMRRLHSLEVLLLLVWRHVDYYSTFSDVPQRKSGGISTASLASSFGKRQTLREDEIPTLLEQVKRGLMPVLERLDGVHLPPDIVGVDHHSREAYIEMMCRLILQAVTEERDGSKATSVNEDVEGLGSW